MHSMTLTTDQSRSFKNLCKRRYEPLEHTCPSLERVSTEGADAAREIVCPRGEDTFRTSRPRRS
jgi:hypothetical protein